MKTKICNLLIIVSLVGVCISIGYGFYVHRYAVHHWDELNEHLTVVKYSDGRLGIRNNETGKVVGCFDEIKSQYCGQDACSFVVVRDNLRGYVSAVTGEVIFEPQFLYAWVDDGESNLAACVDTEHRLGFVNVRTKETTIPFQYDFNDRSFVSYMGPVLDFVFSNGLCIVPGAEGKIGLIDVYGNSVLPIQYEDIINWRDIDTPEIILKRKADDGMGFLYGVCDRDFNLLVPFEFNCFTKVWDYDSQGEVHLYGYIVSKAGKYGLLDSAFNEQLPLKYDYMAVTEHGSYIASMDGKYGVLDNNLKIIVPFEYEFIYEEDSSEGYVAEKNYTSRLFDKTGNLINDFYVKNRYTYDVELCDYVAMKSLEAIPEPFGGGASAYVKYDFHGSCGVVTGTRRVVIPAKYENIEYLGHGNFACTVDGNVFLVHDDK
ncbi:MAG: WG repeat-containing protein [Bacteroidales bacterium]|nr:WG repeat-containing protein [Bacteroidales bacterium]